jgi:hypothetical protein
MGKQHCVRLSEADRSRLHALLAAGAAPTRTLTHARILLKADQGPQGPGWADPAIAAAVEVSVPTIQRVRQRYAQEGLEAAVQRRPPRREYRRKLDGRGEAHLIALACGPAPEGYARWSLRLLKDRLVALEDADPVSYETVRRVLKKTNSSPGSGSSG